MFQVKGDIIEYDGKPFAVITAPLSGFRMEAVDAINLIDEDNEDRIDEALRMRRIDYTHIVVKIINKAINEIWLDENMADWLVNEVRAIDEEG